LKKTKKAIWGFLLPVVILGGIYSGIVTPTEASFLAVLYGFIVSVFIYKELDLTSFYEAVKESVNTTAMIFFIVASAVIFGMFLSNEQVPQDIAAWIQDSVSSKWVFLIMVNIMFFILGMFLEAIAIILITTPILLPLLGVFDINLIHFAVIMVVNLEFAMITPPVGINLFVISGISKEKVGKVVSGVLPFYFLMLIGLVLLILIPNISLLFIE